jgi:cystathionine beta-lyase/cystathionine gamma-synthase
MSEPPKADRAPGFETRAIHGQDEGARYPHGAVSPPIVQSSTFRFASVEAMNAATADPRRGIYYSRRNNPTALDAEARLAGLEGSAGAALFASGMAAITTTVLSRVRAGDHVAVFKDIYGGAVHFFTSFLPRYGVEVSWVDTGDYAGLEAALRPNTKLIYFESPTNPMLKIVDLERVGEIGRRCGNALVFDNTLATPYLQRPLEWGVHGVVYSATKYLCGHSDLIMGAATGGAEWMDAVHNTRYVFGGVVDPHGAWLFSRSLATLALRMERHCDNAERVAEFLAAHPHVSCVYFPGLAEKSQRALAERQMRRYGAMVGFEVTGGGAAADRVVSRLRRIALGASLGGIESLIVEPRYATHRRMSRAQREALGIGEGMLRLSVGLESVDDLIADLGQALEGA